jgi:SEC-C motif
VVHDERSVSKCAVPCGSGRKFKRCCADVLEDPRRIARQHDAAGRRIQAWAFEHHRDVMGDAFAQITSGYTDRVLDDIDLQLIASWMLNDCQLPDGGTAAERYGQRDDLAVSERDVARRIAAAWLGLLRVVRVLPGRWIELHDLAVGGELVRAISHDVSSSVRPHEVLLARLMDGPPASALYNDHRSLAAAAPPAPADHTARQRQTDDRPLRHHRPMPNLSEAKPRPDAELK